MNLLETSGGARRLVKSMHVRLFSVLFFIVSSQVTALFLLPSNSSYSVCVRLA
jgi:hypothetical protein